MMINTFLLNINMRYEFIKKTYEDEKKIYFTIVIERFLKIGYF